MVYRGEELSLSGKINWFIERMGMWGDGKAIINHKGFYTYSAILRALNSKTWKLIPPSSEYNPEWLYGVLQMKNPKVTVTTSGTTGKPKQINISIADTLEKYKDKVPTPYQMIAFLLFNHVGGINTLFRSLASGGTLIIPKTHSVSDVCRAIEEHKANCLPTTPSFLNMLLMSSAHIHYDLSSLRVISFGTEVMPEETMKRLLVAFPNVRFAHTYGTTELGVLETQTNKDNPLLIKVKGGFADRGHLWVRHKNQLIDTGDLVDEHPDGWLRIKGRDTDIINVGGEKIHPLELEEMFLGMNEVDDVVVWGEGNPLMGQIVCAKFNLNMEYTSFEWKKILYDRMKGVDPYMRPVKVTVTSNPLYSDRGKKVRH